MRFPSLLLGFGLLLGGWSSPLVAANNYDLAFSTYFGGSGWEHARDIFADAAGNIYVTGGTASANFPVTPGAYSTVYNAGTSSNGPTTGAFGNCDVFVAKLNPSGQLIWCTFLGGPNYDRAYAIEVDAQGYIIVGGRAGTAFPTTTGAFQTTYSGPPTGGAGNYGLQNGFVAKLSPDGATLVWASYVGVGQVVRDVAVDADGDIYTPLAWVMGSPTSMPAAFSTAFANAFRPARGSGIETGIVKLKGDGTAVLWATWLGGSGDDSQEASIRVDASEQPYLTFNTSSTNVATAGAGSDATANGGKDMFLASLNATSSALRLGTYIGGSGDDGMETHSLALGPAGKIYVTTNTQSTNFPTTADTISNVRKGPADIGVSVFAQDGTRLLGTYLGGTGGENPDGIYVDSTGRAFITAESNSTDFPVTAATARQPAHGGSNDDVIIVLAADLATVEYATYLGGPLYDNARCSFLGADGTLYLAGSSAGAGYPTLRPLQASFAGGSNAFAPGAGDVTIAKFTLVGDGDGDGASNLQEFIDGTQPASGLDFLKLLNPTRAAAQFTASLAGRKGRYYIIERCQNLTGWSELSRTATLAADGSVPVTDNAPLVGEASYRATTVFP